jgi:hypothetical protein
VQVRHAPTAVTAAESLAQIDGGALLAKARTGCRDASSGSPRAGPLGAIFGIDELAAKSRKELLGVRAFRKAEDVHVDVVAAERDFKELTLPGLGRGEDERNDLVLDLVDEFFPCLLG